MPLTPLLPGLIAADVLTRSFGAVKTYRVRLRYEATQSPDALLHALAEIGFRPPPGATVVVASANTRIVLDLTKPGSGQRQYWTADEAQQALADVGTVFNRFALPFIPRTIGLQDLL